MNGVSLLMICAIAEPQIDSNQIEQINQKVQNINQWAALLLTDSSFLVRQTAFDSLTINLEKDNLQ